MNKKRTENLKTSLLSTSRSLRIMDENKITNIKRYLYTQ